MPAALDEKAKTEIVDRLFLVFRDRGYEGTSLADLSEATGLGKSSLYHHFPGGKEQMAEAVLERGKALIQSAIADVAASREPLRKRIRKIVTAFDGIYGGGCNPCILGRLAVAEIGDAGHRLTRETFELWSSAVAELARDSGMPTTRAREYAEDWIARLQGSLILHSATGDPKPFKRALHALTELSSKRVKTTHPQKGD